MTENPPKDSLTVAIVRLFTTSQLSLLFLIISLLAGAVALILTPREEDPQIIVPVMDVFVEFPGASSEEVEKLVTTPLEALLWQIDGVEYVYSVSKTGLAIVTVRYFVGEDREKSVIKTRDKLLSNEDIIPAGVTSWIVKPVEIDDVPILTLTLSSKNRQYGDMALKRIADELMARLRTSPDVGKSWVVGASKRRITVWPDPAKMVAHDVSLQEIERAIHSANINVQAGGFDRRERRILLEAGPFFKTAEEVRSAVIKRSGGRLVYLRDVALVKDGPDDPDHYTRIGFGPAASKMRSVGKMPNSLPKAGEERPMVTVAIAKRRGSNAVSVAKALLKHAEALRGSLVPEDVSMTITRNYGETANHKVNELVKHLGIAVLTIIVLLALTLGFKESLIVSVAVPMTFAVTLLFDFIFGYTINRVTLFALILSLGLLVDDPIVDVENIHRHYRLRKEPPLRALLIAVDEVRPPTIVATLAVIMSFVPMFFITGMMGPYMAPMSFNVPVAMLLSLIIAFTVTPWASYRLLKGSYGKNEDKPFTLKKSLSYRLYHAVLSPLIATPKRAGVFLGLVGIAFIVSAMLAVTRAVPFKLLPFDNKNELQLVIDMPEGAALEQTDEVARALGRYLSTVNEVTDYQSYVGVPSPMDFNGMVRHYYLRRGSNTGDIRINLVNKDEREQQSHDIALRMRPDIERIGKEFDANIKIVELPPGPPVLSTLVAEVYGPPEASYENLIQVSKKVRTAFAKTKGVVDIDDMAEAEHLVVHFRLNREKAALRGITAKQAAQTLKTALQGENIGSVHIETERQPLEIFMRLPRPLRSSVPDLLVLRIKSADGELIPLSEVGSVTTQFADQPIYHKNLQRLAYVIADTAGVSPVDAVVALFDYFDEQPLPRGYSINMAGEGEWKITLDVFRDLGLAFAAALVMIYVLLVGQTGSLSIPLVMMTAIPLTIIGILPGFWLLNLFTEPVAGYAAPIYFTATAMIGMIALAGIVVRNSIILIDFIERIYQRDDKTTLTDALIEAGATRLTPIFLTAAAAVLGSAIIVLDPIFSGLAWSFIFGIVASTLFSLVVIPVVYFLLKRGRPKGLTPDEEPESSPGQPLNL